MELKSKGKRRLALKVTRYASSEACEWCKALSGTYAYDSLPPDIWKKHAYCQCQIVVEYENGTLIDPHTKRTLEDKQLEEYRAGRENV